MHVVRIAGLLVTDGLSMQEPEKSTVGRYTVHERTHVGIRKLAEMEQRSAQPHTFDIPDALTCRTIGVTTTFWEISWVIACIARGIFCGLAWHLLWGCLNELGEKFGV